MDVKETFLKIKISLKYPDIKQLTPLQQILWILEVSFKELHEGELTSEMISGYLWYFRIDMKPRRITNVLNAAKGKLKEY